MKNFKFYCENFTKAEKKILLKFFTNYDLPVFCLINMPEVVKGALFARYSRSEKSLRRLFLDEFYKESNYFNENESQLNEISGNERASPGLVPPSSLSRRVS